MKAIFSAILFLALATNVMAQPFNGDLPVGPQSTNQNLHWGEQLGQITGSNPAPHDYVKTVQMPIWFGQGGRYIRRIDQVSGFSIVPNGAGGFIIKTQWTSRWEDANPITVPAGGGTYWSGLAKLQPPAALPPIPGEWEVENGTTQILRVVIEKLPDNAGGQSEKYYSRMIGVQPNLDAPGEIWVTDFTTSSNFGNPRD